MHTIIGVPFVYTHCENIVNKYKKPFEVGRWKALIAAQCSISHLVTARACYLAGGSRIKQIYALAWMGKELRSTFHMCPCNINNWQRVISPPQSPHLTKKKLRTVEPKIEPREEAEESYTITVSWSHYYSVTFPGLGSLWQESATSIGSRRLLLIDTPSKKNPNVITFIQLR